MRLIGSLAIHTCVIGAFALLALTRREQAPTKGRELVQVAIVSTLPPPKPQTQTQTTTAARTPSARRVSSGAPKRTTGATTRASFDGGVAAALGEIADGGFDSGAGGGGAGRGGDGDGLGAAASGTLSARDLVIPMPKISKARPAKLIYPAKERAVEEGELFLASVTVDDDGYVVGAKLKEASPSSRRDEAAGLIFRFRYLPALDDDGNPIRSTFDQQFLVSR